MSKAGFFDKKVNINGILKARFFYHKVTRGNKREIEESRRHDLITEANLKPTCHF
jgi:hypothetical protein